MVAAQGGNQDNDTFKISGLTLDYNGTTVPEPATLALLGLGAVRRRKIA